MVLVNRSKMYSYRSILSQIIICGEIEWTKIVLSFFRRNEGVHSFAD